MEAFLFRSDAPPRSVPAEQVALPAEGVLWLDVVYGDPAWPTLAERITGVRLDERHVRDSMNLAHPSFFDGTADYDMVIFRSLAPEGGEMFATRPTVFFLLDRVIITVRAADSRSVPLARDRAAQAGTRLPPTPEALMYLVLNTMVDRFLALREPLGRRMELWSEAMLEPHSAGDLPALMGHRRNLRRLQSLAEDHEDVLVAFRENGRADIEGPLAVRYTDLLGHVRRVIKFSNHQQHDLESLVQLHFSAVSNRTNDIMRMLTVVSAIFLPLNLVAGIFGMNFEDMPALQAAGAFHLTLAGMLALALGMLALFRLKRWA